MTEAIKASVVLITYNRSESLDRTLATLAAADASDRFAWELIVVDNNSTDDTRGVVERFAAAHRFPVIYLFEPVQGQSFAKNAGIEKARGEFVVFTDDDVAVEPAWLVRLVERLESSGCAGAGGRILPAWNCPRPDWYTSSGPFRLQGVLVEFDRGDEAKRLTAAPFGANMAFRREVFARHGTFRTDLGRRGGNLLGGEDSEFCSRLIKAGESMIYAPDAVVYHPVQPERVTKSYFQEWYFQFGRASMRIEGVAEGTVCYWGVPRYLVRQWLANVARWLFVAGSARRFYYKLQACANAGTMVEAWQKHRALRRQCC